MRKETITINHYLSSINCRIRHALIGFCWHDEAGGGLTRIEVSWVIYLQNIFGFLGLFISQKWGSWSSSDNSRPTAAHVVFELPRLVIQKLWLRFPGQLLQKIQVRVLLFYMVHWAFVYIVTQHLLYHKPFISIEVKFLFEDL